MGERKTYYCTKCKGNHRHGKIWRDHKKYKLKEEDPQLPSDFLLPFDPFKMRLIALRQIGHLFHKMGSNGKKEMYVNQINNVIKHEMGETN